jgi:hypothetical protein
MTLPCDPRLLLTSRVTQLMLYLREYRIISEQLMSQLNAGKLTGLFLVEKISSITQVRFNLNLLNTPDARLLISNEFSKNCEDELQLIDSVIGNLIDELLRLTDGVAIRTQIVSATRNGQVDSVIDGKKTNLSSILSAVLNAIDPY